MTVGLYGHIVISLAQAA